MRFIINKFISSDFQKWAIEKATTLGGAASYRAVAANSQPNCFGYALELSYSPPLSMSYGDSVDVVYSRAYTYITGTLGRGCRRLTSKDDLIRPYEYKIAMRVGSHTKTVLIFTYTYYDYHFMVQLDNGEWAQKHGTAGASEHASLDPSTCDWGTLYEITNFYDSDTIYFAVTR